MANDLTTLVELGWNDFFDIFHRQYQQGAPASHEFVARVVGEERGLFRVASLHGDFLAVIAGRLRYLADERLDLPAIGDWVMCTLDSSSERGVIHSIFFFCSCITRKEAGHGHQHQILAANVDAALIVTSANAEFNPARLQRYVTAVREGDVTPEIILSKIDLCEDHESLISQIGQAIPGITVHPISVQSGAGTLELSRRFSAGRTFVFLGSSGVGKSTLVNYLLNSEAMATQPISEFESKGRHTTTSRQMFQLPSGALVIDTPGLREFRLGGFEEGLERTYEDILDLARQCRFSDCSHQGEPDCAVEKARTDGSLSEERWNWYLKLQKEVAYQNRRDSGEQARNTKARWKKIHMQAKHILKRKRWES